VNRALPMLIWIGFNFGRRATGKMQRMPALIRLAVLAAAPPMLILVSKGTIAMVMRRMPLAKRLPRIWRSRRAKQVGAFVEPSFSLTRQRLKFSFTCLF